MVPVCGECSCALPHHFDYFSFRAWSKYETTHRSLLPLTARISPACVLPPSRRGDGLRQETGRSAAARSTATRATPSNSIRWQTKNRKEGCAKRESTQNVRSQYIIRAVTKHGAGRMRTALRTRRPWHVLLTTTAQRDGYILKLLEGSGATASMRSYRAMRTMTGWFQATVGWPTSCCCRRYHSFIRHATKESRC